MLFLFHLFHFRCRISGVESNLFVFMLQQCPLPILDFNLLEASKDVAIRLWCLTDTLDVSIHPFIMVLFF